MCPLYIIEKDNLYRYTDNKKAKVPGNVSLGRALSSAFFLDRERQYGSVRRGEEGPAERGDEPRKRLLLHKDQGASGASAHASTGGSTSGGPSRPSFSSVQEM